MSRVRDLLVGTAETLFSTHVTKDLIDAVESGDWPHDLWSAIVENGLHDALVAEADGGAGLTLADVVAVLRVAGRHAAPVPLAESLVGHRLLADAGLPRPNGIVTVPTLEECEEAQLEDDGRWRVTLDLPSVPWGARSETIVVPAKVEGRRHLVAIPTAACTVERIDNLAGEPRDRVTATALEVGAESVSAPLGDAATLLQLGALSRLALMSGALESILEITVDYARERVQFGRPIGRFQAVQQQLARMAGEVAASKAAADAAADATDRGAGSLAIGAAKARVGEAVAVATRVAHQTHGAIGFTHEHQLHHRTRRLWAWRNEFGTEDEWAAEIGRQVVAGGGTGLWPMLVGAANGAADGACESRSPTDETRGCG